MTGRGMKRSRNHQVHQIEAANTCPDDEEVVPPSDASNDSYPAYPHLSILQSTGKQLHEVADPHQDESEEQHHEEHETDTPAFPAILFVCRDVVYNLVTRSFICCFLMRSTKQSIQFSEGILALI